MFKIGFMGIDIDNGNKGVAALGYAAIKLIDEIACSKGIMDAHYVLFNNSIRHMNDGALDVITGRKTEVSTYNYSFKKVKQLVELNRQIKDCSLVIDFTGGDSFSDIYGVKRMLKVSFEKFLAIRQKKNLVLAPQTYGPYKHWLSKKLAKYIITRASAVFSRDEKSMEILKHMKGVHVKTVTDVAFYLPYHKEEITSEKIKAGVNVSMLLWNGGYTGNNQFGLKTDYKEYCIRLIKKLVEDGRYEVHLIPHVIAESVPCENDCLACEELHEMYPQTIVAPKFHTPIEAKNYISAMDVFTGARMHSTIGAFSSGVATIPFAYSKKFEGVFGNYNYSYMIDGMHMETDEAVEKTIEYMDNYHKLNGEVRKSAEITDKLIEILKDDIGQILEKVSEGKK